MRHICRRIKSLVICTVLLLSFQPVSLGFQRMYDLDVEFLDTYILLNLRHTEACHVFQADDFLSMTQIQGIYNDLASRLIGDESKEDVYEIFEELVLKEAVCAISNGKKPSILIERAPEALRKMGADIYSYSSLIHSEREEVFNSLSNNTYDGIDNFVRKFNVEVVRLSVIETAVEVNFADTYIHIVAEAKPGTIVGIEIIYPDAEFPPLNRDGESLKNGLAYMWQNEANSDGIAEFTYKTKAILGIYRVRVSSDVEGVTCTASFSGFGLNITVHEKITGIVTSVIPANGGLAARLLYVNTTEQAKDIVILFAEYKGNKLSRLKILKGISVPAGSGEAIIENIPTDLHEATKISFFAWDGLNTIVPLLSKYELNQGDFFEGISYNVGDSKITMTLDLRGEFAFNEICMEIYKPQKGIADTVNNENDLLELFGYIYQTVADAEGRISITFKLGQTGIYTMAVGGNEFKQPVYLQFQYIAESGTISFVEEVTN